MPFIVETRTGDSWEYDLTRVYPTSAEAHENCNEGETVSLISEQDIKILEFIRRLKNTRR